MKSEYRRAVISGIIAAAVLLMTFVGAFAYFRGQTGASGGVSTDSDDTERRIEISTFSELYRYTRASYYNDPSSVSPADIRYTLVLGADLALDNDLTVTADVELDLNGHSLSLDGNTLTFSHGYRGTTVISDGNVLPYSTVEEDEAPVAGGIVFDIPYSAYLLDGVTFADNDGGALLSEDYVTVLSCDPTYTAYCAFYYISDFLIDALDERPDRLDYSEVAALTPGFDITLHTRSGCAVSGAGENCVFASRDIPLPATYQSRSVTVEYSSDNLDLLSPRGDVTLPTDTADATLTATVTVGDSSFTSSVKVHVYNPASDAAMLSVAETLILSRLDGYIAEDGVTRVFNRGIYLPTAVGTAAVEWSCYTDAEGNHQVPSKDVLTELTGGRAVIFEPTSDSVLLRAVISSGGESRRVDIPMVSGNTGLITTNASVARDIVEAWYGGSIVVTPIFDEFGLNILSYSSVTLNSEEYDVTLYDKYGITLVEYELMNNTFDVYRIDELDSNQSIVKAYALRVNKDKHPADYVQGVLLNCKFTFGSGSESTVEQIQIPVIYEGGNVGDNINEFLPYYTFFNENLYAALAGATVKDFTMPYCYGNTGPIILFDTLVEGADGTLTMGMPACMHIVLYYGGAERATFSYPADIPEGYSLSDEFDSWLESLGVTLEDIIEAGDAKWIFRIDQSIIPPENTRVHLVYNYKMDVSYSGWITYVDEDSKPVTSPVTVSGVLHNDSTDIPDRALYEWIYLKFNVSADTAYDDGELIITDWLAQNITLDSTVTSGVDALLYQVTDFKGLDYLVGTKNIILKNHPSLVGEANAERCDATARYISNMRSLDLVDLSGCYFRDRTDPQSNDNGTISGLANISGIRYLYLVDTPIYSYEWLLDMPSVERVDLYYSSNASTPHSGIEAVFYGAEGLVNLSVFGELTDNGVAVYNTASSGVAKLFEDLNGINDYIRLTSVEYQKKLAKGVSIERLFSTLSTDPDDYELSSSYEGVNGTVGHSLAFSYEGDATDAEVFYLTDTISLNGNEVVVVTVKFKITRF